MLAIRFATVVIALMAMTSGCTTTSIKMDVPDGFAQYKDSAGLRAISADAVVYQIRELENKPSAGLEFWKKALKKQMIDSGYHFVAESDINGVVGLGYLIELAAPIQNEDYTYLVALYVDENRLIVIESTGEVTKVKRYREGIVTAMQNISF